MQNLTTQDIDILKDSLAYRIEVMENSVANPIVKREIERTKATLEKLKSEPRLQTWQEDH